MIIDCRIEDLDAAAEFWSHALGSLMTRHDKPAEANYVPLKMVTPKHYPIASDQRRQSMASSEQKFCLSRAQDGDFVPLTGYRDWLKIRDLGLSKATNGQYFAHVTCANELGGTTGPHYHEVDFQILYVLKGWVKFEYEEEGEVTLNVGDFVYHPPRMVHNLVDYSPDVELFELLSPAQYATIDL